MELRLLTAEADRKLFSAALAESRSTKGARFTESARSRQSDIAIAFGRLYGLFDETAAHPRLLGGFSIHSLEEFSQSHPYPNLIHLPPDRVFEAGQLWAISPGAALSLRLGSMILLSLFRAEALIIYPIVGPRNVSTLYSKEYRRVGPPFPLPFARTASGEEVWVQAMVLDGEELRQQIDLAAEHGFDTRHGHRILRFDSPCAPLDKTVRPESSSSVVFSDANI